MKKTFAEDKFWGNMKLAVIAMVVTYLTSLVDYVLVGQVLGEQALAAYALVGPYMSIIAFFSFLISSGSAMMIAMEVGKGSREEGNSYFSQGIILSIAVGILLSLVFLLSRNLLTSNQNIPDSLQPLIKQYFLFMSLLPAVQILNIYLYGIIWNAGADKYCFLSLVLQFLSNILFSILLMKGIGIGGIALGTLIGYLLGSVVFIFYFCSDENVFGWKWHIRLATVRNAMRFSLQDSSSYLILAILQFIMNTYLVKHYGVAAILIFSVIMNLENLYMTVFGTPADAVIVLINVFVGEKNPKGIVKCMKVAHKVAVAEGVFAMLFLFIFAKWIPGWFGIVSAASIKDTVMAIRIFSLSAVIFPLIILYSTYYLAINQVVLSVEMLLMQVLIMPVCCGVVFSKIGGLTGVWVGFTAGTFLTVFINAFSMKYRFKGKEHPYLLDKESLGKQLSYDVPITTEGVMSLVDMVEKDLAQRGVEKKKIYKIMLMIEETEMLVVEKNQGERGIIACDLFLGDEIRLILRDSGPYSDATDRDCRVNSFRAYTASMLIGGNEDSKYLITCGGNRTLYWF